VACTNFVKAFRWFSIDLCRKHSRVKDDPMSFAPPMYTKQQKHKTEH